MLFNSWSYMVFLPVVFMIYWMVAEKYKTIVLLMASYFFYASWSIKYLLIIIGVTAVSYTAGRIIESSETPTKRKLLVATVILILVGLLFTFKYLPTMLEAVDITLRWVLPVGISFYTFQAMGYVIDVYRGDINAEHDPILYATFIAFFPQLVAGPIERSKNLLPQIKAKKRFSSDQAILGTKLILIGFYKKTVIADGISPYVDQVYANVRAYSGLGLAISIFFFTVQIYCDFSGYSDIAIGTAKLLGIDLMKNFSSPYMSVSLREFWQRWHISLSTWFRDYVYIPLGGSRCNRLRSSMNLLFTFLVSGIWHGAGIRYLIWGGIHGMGSVLEKQVVPINSFFRNNKLGRVLSWMFIFVFCNLAWIFFRVESITDAIYVLVHVFDGITNPINYISHAGLDETPLRLLYFIILIFLLAVYDFCDRRGDIIERIGKRPVINKVFWFACLMVVILFSQKGVAREFIYFQF